MSFLILSLYLDLGVGQVFCVRWPMNCRDHFGIFRDERWQFAKFGVDACFHFGLLQNGIGVLGGKL